MNSVETTRVPVEMVRERSGALMSPRGPGADVTAWARCGSTHSWIYIGSLRSHPVPSLRWGCENTIKYLFLASFSAPWCHLSDGCHLTHDHGSSTDCLLRRGTCVWRFTVVCQTYYYIDCLCISLLGYHPSAMSIRGYLLR